MKKAVVLALLLIPVVVLGSTWVLTPAGPVTQTPSDAPPREPTAVAVPGDSTAAAERGAIPVVSVPAVLPASDAFRVHGRCVDLESGAPIGGCAVEARLGLRDGRDIWRPWQAGDVSAEQTTGVDGTFSIPLHGDFSLGCTVRVTAESRVRRAGHWSHPEAELDVGDLAMTIGFAVHGQVVDESGAGVARSFVLLAPADASDSGTMSQGGLSRAATDAFGRFEYASLMRAGDYYVVMQGDGSLIEPRTVRIDGPDPEVAITVRVKRPDPAFSITGNVVDEEGLPLAGMFVVAIGEGAIGRTESATDGSFSVPRSDRWNDDGSAGVRLTATDASGMWDQHLPASDARFAWGQRGLRIVMRRLASRTILVTDLRGEPVEDCTIYAYELVEGHPTAAPPYPKVDGRGPHRGGRLRLDGLDRGESAVLVVPTDARLASRVVQFRGDAADGEVEVRLPDRVQLEVQVQDGDGVPVVGSRVEVVRLLRVAELETTSPTVPVRGLDPRVSAPNHGLLDECTTGSDGGGVLEVPPGSLWLRVTGDEHAVQVEPLVMPPQALVHRIVVRSGASLLGKLVPAAAIAALQEVAELQPDDERGPFEVVLRGADAPALPPFPVEDRSFRAAGLEPGEYGVALRYRLKSHPVLTNAVTVPLATITVRRGEHRSAEFDLSEAVPATVRGRITVDGQPLRSTDVFLRRIGSSFPGSVRIATDADGHVAANVPPGEYGVAIVLPVEGGPGWIVLPIPKTVTVRRAGPNDLICDALNRRARIRLLAADGEPVAEQRLRIVQPGYFRPGSLATDTDGWFEFGPVPYGEFAIEWTTGEATKSSVLVTIPGVAPVTELIVRAPG